jgi:hypothetical protein
MSKSKQYPEFYIAFHVGMSRKDLIARGYAKGSVYNYFRRYNREVKENFDKLLKAPAISQPLNLTEDK